MYRYQFLETTMQGLENELNALEALGWALVSITVMPNRALVIAILRIAITNLLDTRREPSWEATPEDRGRDEDPLVGLRPSEQPDAAG